MSDIPSVLDERKEAIEARSTGLGGTDIAAVIGLNPWKSALDVWLGKLGMSQPKDITEAMEWGNYQEAGIRAAYERRTGWGVFRVNGGDVPAEQIIGEWEGGVLLRHHDLPYLIGTPDGIVPAANRGLEVKTCAFKNEDWGTPGSDKVPIQYLLQCAQYMAITKLSAWDLAVLFSGNRLEIYTVYRNFELESQILEAATWFWINHVLARVQPAIDGSDSCTRYLGRKYALGNQTYIDADPEIIATGEGLRQLQWMTKQAEQDEAKAKNLLAEFIGENKGCYFPDGSRAQWIRPKSQMVTDWEGLAYYLFGERLADPETQARQIAAYTSEQPGTPYIRLFDPPANRKKLKA